MKKLLALILIIVTGASCDQHKNEVIVYCALDRIYAEPLLRDFEKETGIHVKAVFDTEITKTVGLVNRIIAESSNPQCDVFWNNEISRTIVLQKKGLLASYKPVVGVDIPDEFKDTEGYWTGFAARGRIIIYNKDKMKNSTLPSSVFDLIKPEWQGKAAIAYPLFGTTATHFAALYVMMGKDSAAAFFNKINQNKIGILDGNATVKDQVASGEFLWGFTDTDDANGAICDGKNIGIIYPDQDGIGTLIIPNTICMIKKNGDMTNGKRFIDYVLRPETEKLLAFSRAAQIPVRKNVPSPATVMHPGIIKIMAVKFEKVAEEMEKSELLLKDIFIK